MSIDSAISTANFNTEQQQGSSSSDFCIDLVNQAFSEPSIYSKCLPQLLKLLNWQGSQRQLIESLPHFQRELTLFSLIEVMDRLGYSLGKFTASVDELDSRLTPSLFVSDTGNTFVIKEVADGVVIATDLASNTDVIIDKKNGFGKIYYFYIKEKQEYKSGKVNYIKKYFFENSKHIYQVLIINLFQSLMILTVPLFTKIIYDKVINNESVSMLYYSSAGAIIAMLSLFYLYSLRTSIMSVISANIYEKISNIVFEKIIQLPTSSLEGASLSEQLARIKDFDQAREFLSGQVVNIMLEAPFIIFFMVCIVLFTGSLVLIPIVAIGVFFLLGFFLKSIIKNSTNDYAKKHADYEYFVTEAMVNVRTIKSSANEKIWLKKYRAKLSQLNLANYKISITNSISEIISDVIMIGSGLAILSFGTLQVIAGNISIGGLIASMILIWRIMSPLKVIFSSFPRYAELQSSIAQLNNLINLSDENNGKKENRFTIKGEIEFIRVGQRYRPDLDPTLTYIDFHITPGEIVALSGNNGSGKSTLLKLLLRLYDVQLGNIKIDNMDIRQFDINVLRENIGYVPQNIEFFYGTIRQNLHLANPIAKEDEMSHAVEMAGILSSIKGFKKGFDTQLSECYRKNMASSFIKKLALARAYIKNPPILLLDEPCSTMDAEGEEKFLETLATFKGNKTVLMSCHRPSHMKLCDRVILVEDGRVVANGAPGLVIPKIIGN